MGPSSCVSYYEKINAAVLAPGATEAQCSGPTGSKFGFNRAYADLKTSYNTLRESQCLTPEVRYAEEIDTAAQELNQIKSNLDTEKAKFTAYLSTLDTLQHARGPFDTYMRELDAEEKALTAEHIKLQQKIRAGRRRFLDNDPQGGVTSVLGLQTADDKILLAFWICFAVGIMAIEVILMKYYGSILQFLSLQQKIALFLGVLAVCMGIAQYFIRTYA